MDELPTIKIVRSHRKTLALHVQADGTIIVRAPLYLPRFMINRFLEKHSDWIEEQRKASGKAKKSFADRKTILFLGKEYALVIGNFSAIAIHGDSFHFPKALLFRAEKELTTWYIQQARDIITRQVDSYAEQMETSYSGLTFSDTRSQWGSCSRENHLQFCWRLVMAPLLTLNYVVVHELSHTLERNHSRAFWSKVRFFVPSYKQQIKWLKTHGNALLLL